MIEEIGMRDRSLFTRLILDLFLWWAVGFLFVVTRISASLPTDVLSEYGPLRSFCDQVGIWLPWIPKTATTYEKFPEVAQFLLSTMWVSLPVQIGVMMWLLPRSRILKAETIPYLRKYPVRFPVGLLAGVVLSVFSAIQLMDAAFVARLTGWRPSGFMSHMPESQSWFGFGVGFNFFAIAFFSALLLNSVSGLKFHQGE